MTFEQRMKAVVWTEVEVAAAVAGAVIAGQFLRDEKIFSKDFKEHPEWFKDGRDGAKFLIYWSGGIKAGASLLASTYVANPWIKLILMGVALQGTVQQARVLTYDKDKKKNRLNKIGDAASDLDAQLKAAADKYRTMSGNEYINGNRYINGLTDPLASRYASSVGAMIDPLASRYASSVGYSDEEEVFSLKSHDNSGAF